MLLLHALLTADTSRDNLELVMSEQMLMEFFVRDLTPQTKAQWKDKRGSFLSVCPPPGKIGPSSWRGLACSQAQQIRRLQWNSRTVRPMAGTLDFTYMPRNIMIFEANDFELLEGKLPTSSLPDSLCHFVLMNEKMSGTVDFTRLPRLLVRFRISRNKFHGSVNLEALPEGMTTLCADHNNFSGSIALDKLPVDMCVLELDHNWLSGSVDLCHLPKHIKKLELSDNALSGEVDVNHLPDSMENIFLSTNQFRGKFRLTKPPKALKNIVMNFNMLHGKAVVVKRAWMTLSLKCSGVEMVVGPDGKEVFVSDFVLGRMSADEFKSYVMANKQKLIDKHAGGVPPPS